MKAMSYALLAMFSCTLSGMEEVAVDYTTQLRYGIAHLDFKCVEEALDQGADVQQVDDNQDTFLHHVVFRAERCDEEKQRQRVVPIVELLIGHGARVNAGNVRGRVPLHAAAFLDAKPVIDCLRKHGAHDTAIDNNGCGMLDVFLHGWKCRQLLTADMHAMRTLCC